MDELEERKVENKYSEYTMKEARESLGLKSYDTRADEYINQIASDEIHSLICNKMDQDEFNKLMELVHMRECKNCGEKFDKIQNSAVRINGEEIYVCPKCGHEEVYGINREGGISKMNFKYKVVERLDGEEGYELIKDCESDEYYDALESLIMGCYVVGYTLDCGLEIGEEVVYNAMMDYLIPIYEDGNKNIIDNVIEMLSKHSDSLISGRKEKTEVQEIIQKYLIKEFSK